MPFTVTAFIALGSNLGDRAALIAAALHEIGLLPGTTVMRSSTLLQTAAVCLPGASSQGDYLNVAAEISTNLNAAELLAGLLAIERGLGRDRAREERWGARFIDLDLLLYGDCVIDAPGLSVPHPRMHERRFVLKPLSEIAPDAVHPLSKTTVRAMLAGL